MGVKEAEAANPHPEIRNTRNAEKLFIGSTICGLRTKFKGPEDYSYIFNTWRHYDIFPIRQVA